MKDKIIEEMAEVMSRHYEKGGICGLKDFAEALYNAGYRKITENEVVLTRGEYDELQKGVKTHNYTAAFNAQNEDRWLDGYKLGFKEGVQALQIQLKEIANKETHRTIFGEFVEVVKE